MIISGYYYVMRLLTDPPIFIVDFLSLLSSLYLSFDCVIIIIKILQLATRMVTVGKIKEFNPQTESFSTYVDRLQLYFKANGVSEDKEVAMFLTVIGPINYSIINDAVVAPEKPKDKALQELIDILKTHFDPKPLEIAEHFHFHKRVQKLTESLSEYVAELRRLAVTCDLKAFTDDIRDFNPVMCSEQNV